MSKKMTTFVAKGDGWGINELTSEADKRMMDID